MVDKSEAPKKYSRRDLVKSAAFGAAGVVTAGVLASCAQEPTAAPAADAPVAAATECPVAEVPECPAPETPWLPASWDYETDVVVVGYGYGGACAAIAAKDAGSEVIILEKTPTAEGGNSGCCSGTMHTYLQADKTGWLQKFQEHSWGTFPNEEVATHYIDEALKTEDWLKSLGMDITEMDGNASNTRVEGISGRVTWKDQRPAPETASAGLDIFAFENDIVNQRGIQVLLGSPVVELYQDPATGEVLGVKAMTGVEMVKWSRENPSCFTGGTEINVKARKAVILACGGYEGNPDMQYNFNYPGIHLYPWGTPYNTGDGIKLVAKVNAQLWHMHGLEWAAVNFKKATEEAQYSIGMSATTAMTPDNHIFVNRTGKRFMNETKSMGHDVGHKAVADFSASKSEYLNVPFWVIFDDTVCKAGPIAPELGRTGQRTTYYSVHGDNVRWSVDNSAEIEKGWIVKADTLEELAALAKGTDFYGREYTIDPAGLVEAVAAYNALVDQGEEAKDPYGRDVKRMAKIETGPFYACELGLTTINTQGGPARGVNSETLGWDNQPIPRLYNVGEFGSINGFEYVAGNIVEAHTSGRMAGEHAASLEAWG